MGNPLYQVLMSVNLWAVCLSSTLNTWGFCLCFFHSSFFRRSCFCLYSAMNMDRFEKGPREILNPEIQKVRMTPAQRQALNEIQHRPISCQPGSATSKLHNVLRLCHLQLQCWSVTVVVSSFPRTCWCWRNRRYEYDMFFMG